MSVTNGTSLKIIVNKMVYGTSVFCIMNSEKGYV